MTGKPIVIASSVIRSTVRGDSHGGLYVTDFNTNLVKQVLDWNFPDIRWDSGGGDRGLRGMAFWNDHLYTAGATYLYKFNKKFELVGQFNNKNFDGTHEICLHNNQLYCVSNSFDSILCFNLETHEFDWGFQHRADDDIYEFDPREEEVPRSDKLHLDAVSIMERVTFKDRWIYYAGSTTTHLFGYNRDNKNRISERLFHRNTHNATKHRSGIVYNRSLESQTCYQFSSRLIKQWDTPKVNVQSIPGDHARIGYTRGMVIKDDWIAVGTSPAAVNLYNINQENQSPPISIAILSNDIRNSVCGMAEYPWELK